MDTLSYTLCDTIGSIVNCSTALVIITVRPIANNDEIGNNNSPNRLWW